MSCRIDRLVTEDHRVILRVSGRIRGDDVSMLKQLLKHEQNGVVIDLEEITLVDRDAVAFLARSERSGTQLLNCPPYVREWINRGKRSQR